MEINVLEKLTGKDPTGKYLCVSLFDQFNYRGHICLSFPVLGQSTFDFQKDNGYRPYTFEHVRHMTYQVKSPYLDFFFYFLVGLELKREILIGQLSTKGSLALPCVAALLGIACPALIYTGFNYNNPAALSGWAIPSATDIAFALGIFSGPSRGKSLIWIVLSWT